MNVKVISISKSLVEGKELSAEELLVYIARVSNPANQLNTETADKLLGYMIKNKHWSPFDMANLCVEVTTSKAITIQILRHWSIKPQEFSQRYAEVVDIEPIQLRRAGTNNRQSSAEVFDPMIDVNDILIFTDRQTTEKVYEPASQLIENHILVGKRLYRALLKAEVAKECARGILPMATSSTIILNGSVRSWIHYLEQRTDLHAQLEHREVAALIKDIFMQHFPMVSKALGF